MMTEIYFPGDQNFIVLFPKYILINILSCSSLGKKVPLTWTKLAATASAGDTTINLVHPVEWNVDDEIVIASTGNHHSQSENEKKTIAAISSDKMTLTLDSALKAEHLGTEETFNGTRVEFRAEVGLLTHNVVVRGNSDPDWNQKIEACPNGFNTGINWCNTGIKWV